MNIFTDTNLPIGYAIPYDKWHDCSVKLIQKPSYTIYWSNLVEEEYGIKLGSIIDDIEIFSNEVKEILKNNEKDFSSYSEFEKFLLKRTKGCNLDKDKKIKLIEDFWIKNNIIEGISEDICIKFDAFRKDLQNIFYERDMDLKDILILHDCGVDNYLRYYKYAVELNDNGIHKPDCKIVVDAHDCGLIHDNLIFMSNDNKLLEPISKIDTSHLAIIEFKSYC